MSTIDTESSLHTHDGRHTVMTGDSNLPETYHLESGTNFGVWAYRMKNLLQKDGRFRYCLTPPTKSMSDEEKMARLQVMSIINSNAKNNALKILRRYNDPYECWTGLKKRYESDSGPRRAMLIDKFFAMRKTESISMDAHLTEVREITDLLEEVDVSIPEDIIVYYTLKHLPKEYEIFKKMQIAGQTLPTYEQLEAKLISEETAIKMECQEKEEGEALFLHRPRRPQSNFRNGGGYRQSGSSSTPQRHFDGGYRRHPESGGSRPQDLMSSLPEPGGMPTPKYSPHHRYHNPIQSRTAPTQQPRFRPRGPETPRSDKCNYCGLDGHYERECDLKSILDRMREYEQRLQERRNRTLSAQAHHVEEPLDMFSPEHKDDTFESADQIVDACLVELNLVEKPHQASSWYLDSGATHHVSGDPSIFSSLHRTEGAQVRSAGGQSHSVTGIGNADVCFSSEEINIQNVLYTPGITKKLLSVGSLTDQQKTLVFKSKGCFVINNLTRQIEAFAPREHSKGLYKLPGVIPTITSKHIPELHSEVHVVQLSPKSVLWHKRLGHFHTRGLQRMINTGAVNGLPSLRFAKQTCTGCQLGKHSKTKMPKETKHHTSKILELVHSDVCGPFRVASTGGARYFVTFTDDFSRKIWVYFITHKNQVLTKFQHFVRLVENSTGQSIKSLRTDNGGEYISTDFHNFCLEKGISRELTPPYTPQRNGVAERRNRSLLDITRCLLLEKSLPGHLWGEAVKAAGDILNLRSTKRHPDRTPNELFSGKKPTVTHLRVFGSSAFAHTPHTSRSKLDPRSERCILLSFDETAKAYRCYRPSTKRVFVSRDIFIDEDTPPTTNSTRTNSPSSKSVSILTGKRL